MIRLSTVAAAVQSQGIKCLIYGGSGVGKTPLCGTAPAPLIISGEKGLLSLRSSHPNVAVIEIRGMADLTEAYNWCYQSREAAQFYTICVDSISDIMEVLLAEEMKKNKDPRKAYGELLTQGLSLARGFRDIPGKAVVIIAKEEYTKDESTGMLMYQPMLPGQKLGPQLPYFFDETFQMIVGKDSTNRQYRALRTQRTYNVVARDRSGLLDEFEQADLTKVFTKILGYKA